MKAALTLALILAASWAWGQEQPKIATPLYWTAVGAASALTGWDAQSSQAGYSRNPYCQEIGTAWLYGARPSAEREWLTMSGEVVASSAVSYLLKRHHRRWWIVPLVWTASVHAHGAISNTLHSCPAAAMLERSGN